MARRLTGRQPRKGRDGGWVYPLLEDAIAEAVLQENETYVYRRQNTVEQHIATRSIMDLCLAAKRGTGPRVATRWWEQEGLDLEGMRTVAQEAEQTEGAEETDRRKSAMDEYLSGEDNILTTTLGTDPNLPLAYAPGLELHHPIMSKLGAHVGQ